MAEWDRFRSWLLGVTSAEELGSRDVSVAVLSLLLVGASDSEALFSESLVGVGASVDLDSGTSLDSDSSTAESSGASDASASFSLGAPFSSAALSLLPPSFLSSNSVMA